MFLRIAYGLGNLFHDIRGETSAYAQDGPPAVPKTDMGVRLMHTRSIPCLGIGEYRCPLEIGSYCYIFNILWYP